MFIALDTYRQHVPIQCGEAEDHFYLAMAFSTESPWFLLTCLIDNDVAEFYQTVAVAWEDTLIKMVEGIGAEKVASIHRIHVGLAEPGAWELKSIEALWIPSEAERATTGMLLYRLRGEAAARDSFGAVVGENDGRQLLLNLAEQ